MKITRTQAGKQLWLRTFTASRTVREVEAAFEILEKLQGRDLEHLKADAQIVVARLQNEQGMTEEQAVQHFTHQTAGQYLWAPTDGHHRRNL